MPLMVIVFGPVPSAVDRVMIKAPPVMLTSPVKLFAALLSVRAAAPSFVSVRLFSFVPAPPSCPGKTTAAPLLIVSAEFAAFPPMMALAVPLPAMAMESKVCAEAVEASPSCKTPLPAAWPKISELVAASRSMPLSTIRPPLMRVVPV